MRFIQISFLFFYFVCRMAAQTIVPVHTMLLPDSLMENSGLIYFNDRLWTHNDDTDCRLYTIDTTSVAINSIFLNNVTNKEWEDIAQNSQYIFLGDFGNNANGNREDLHILRIEKNSLLAGLPAIDTISFSYSNQVDFSGSGSNNTDFDCEAMIATEDSIFLFTKQWLSHKTALYSFQAVPGVWIAQKRAEFDCQGLVTGADISPSGQRIVLCGYSETLQPFIILCSGFYGNRFFSGTTQKLNVSLSMHQVEGIASVDENIWYLGNEKFTLSSVVNIPPAIHRLDLTSIWSSLNVFDFRQSDGINVFPDPSQNGVFSVYTVQESFLMIYSSAGNLVDRKTLSPGETKFYLPLPGIYILHAITQDNNQVIKLYSFGYD